MTAAMDVLSGINRIACQHEAEEHVTRRLPGGASALSTAHRCKRCHIPMRWDRHLAQYTIYLVGR